VDVGAINKPTPGQVNWRGTVRSEPSTGMVQAAS
jgi:hypothetical protein